jgi:hypothetical protein
MKSSQQISLYHTKKGTFQNKTTFEKKPYYGKNLFFLRRQNYPDFRFSCPNCGTLEVLLEFKPFDTLKGHCLDCKTEWNEDSKQ